MRPQRLGRGSSFEVTRCILQYSVGLKGRKRAKIRIRDAPHLQMMASRGFVAADF
jgi:hypothetical protein